MMKMWYIYTKYYPAIKKNEITGKWMKLEIIMLREIRQTKKDKYCMLSFMQNENLKNDRGDCLGWEPAGSGDGGKGANMTEVLHSYV
jgi:hypothetical protein